MVILCVMLCLGFILWIQNGHSLVEGFVQESWPNDDDRKRSHTLCTGCVFNKPYSGLVAHKNKQLRPHQTPTRTWRRINGPLASGVRRISHSSVVGNAYVDCRVSNPSSFCSPLTINLCAPSWTVSVCVSFPCICNEPSVVLGKGVGSMVADTFR